LCFPKDNAKTVEEKQPFLVASQLETDYPLLVMGGSQLLSKSALFSVKTGVLASFGAEVDTLLIPEEIALVINCESGWRQSARGLAGEVGIGQFMPDTWKKWNIKRGTDLDINSAEDQLDMMKWAWDNNLQNNWTCWRQLK